jgi:signal transduction histidine kinase
VTVASDRFAMRPRPSSGEEPWDQPAKRELPVVISIRLAVVASIGLLLFVEAPVEPERRLLIGVVLAVAGCYALGLLVARLSGWSTPPSWLLTATDGVLALIACSLTGGGNSQVVAVLPLVVIAATLRAGQFTGLGVAAGVGIAFTGVSVIATALPVTPAERWVIGAWWTGYLLATATLVGVLSRQLERQYAAVAESRALALEEHEAFLEERDLRERLLESQQARHDGLKVILHEFRTPVASMTALSRGLASGDMDDATRATALSLVADHATHLQEMLDSLADLAIEDGSPLGRARERTIRLGDLAVAAFDAAGVEPERQRVTIQPEDAVVRHDAQRLRRVLTNLLENAARHSASAPVELELVRDEENLVVEIRDRGPGLPESSEVVVTRKYVSLGERHGTTGLGLWIVDQLVAAMHGELSLLPRPGGGLVARLVLPLAKPIAAS